MAVLLSGLMFGLFHGNLAQFAYAFSLGAFLAFIYVRTGRVVYTIVLHMGVNFIGSIVGPWVLELADYRGLTEALRLLEEDPARGIAAIDAVWPGLALLGGYIAVMLGIAVTGAVLLLVHRKRLRLGSGAITIPKGRRFTTAIVNCGMLLFIGFWALQIISQLFD